MKKQLLFLSLAVLLAGGGFFAAKTIGANKLPDLTLANIEAMTMSCEYKRADDACSYEIGGTIGAKIKVLGIGVLTVGGDGYAFYHNDSGKTTCSAGGVDDCASRYCENLTILD